MKKLNIKDFIDCWEKFYDEGRYPDKIYFDCISKNKWRIGDLDKVFEWKNGSKLSERKLEILQKVYKNLDKINAFRDKNSPTERDFHDFYRNISCNIISSGLVWRIFLIHISHPDKYPMIDKFNFIAYEFLKNNNLLKKADDILRREQLQAYQRFTDFFIKINKSVNNYRKVDKALMAFGQFLSDPSKKIYI